MNKTSVISCRVNNLFNSNLTGEIPFEIGNLSKLYQLFLYDNKLPILGTQYTSIDLAEDRDRFRNLLNKLKLKQAQSGIAKTFKQAIQISEKIGLPLMVRPSYVLGGRAMEIVYEEKNLDEYFQYSKSIWTSRHVPENNPILLDRFLVNAKELDVDLIRDKENNIYIDDWWFIYGMWV